MTNIKYYNHSIFALLCIVLIIGCSIEGQKNIKELESPVLDAFSDSTYKCITYKDTVQIGAFMIEITQDFYQIGIPEN